MFSTIRTFGRCTLPLVAALATLATAACGGGDGGDSTGPGPTTTEATVTVVNSSSNGSVMFLRYRSCGSSGWSSDVLGASILSSGEQTSWQLSPGCYDVRATPAEVGLDYLYFTGVQLDSGESETLTITAFPTE